jgi:hypothetical protein
MLCLNAKESVASKQDAIAKFLPHIPLEARRGCIFGG